MMQNPDPTCAMCNHEQRAAASAMLRIGASFQEIATAFQMSDVDAIEKHFRDHAPLPALAVDPRNASDAQLASLLNDSSELYYSAALQNNLPAASSSLAVRLRCIAEMGERETARDKREQLLEGADPCDPHTWPDELHKFIAAYMDGILTRATEAEYQNEVIE